MRILIRNEGRTKPDKRIKERTELNTNKAKDEENRKERYELKGTRKKKIMGRGVGEKELRDQNQKRI